MDKNHEGILNIKAIKTNKGCFLPKEFEENILNTCISYMFKYMYSILCTEQCFTIKFFLFSSSTSLHNYADTAKCHSALKIN